MNQLRGYNLKMIAISLLTIPLMSGGCFSSCPCNQRLEFKKALLSDNQEIGIITAEKRVFPTGEWSSDRCRNMCKSRSQGVVASYNIKNDRVKVLHRVNLAQGESCKYAFLASVKGTKAILATKEYYCLIDIETGKSLKIDKSQQLKSKCKSHFSPKLLNQQGTLLLDCSVENKRKITGNSVENELFVYYPDSEIKNLGRASTIYILGDQIYYWDFITKQPMVYDFEIKTQKLISDQEFQQKTRGVLRFNL